MKSLWTLLIAGALALATTGVARAGDDNPPPWRGLPRTTTQGWNFLNGPTQTPNMPVFHNPYSWPQAPFPQMLPGNWTVATIPDATGQPVTVICVGPGQSLDFLIPNNYDPFTIKECWVQIKYFGPTPGLGGVGFHPDGSPMSPGFPPSGGPTFTPGHGPIPGSSELTIRMQFDGNPAWEIIRIQNQSTFDNLYIYQVVIDTICPTPGTAAAGLVGVGLLASRRRR